MASATASSSAVTPLRYYNADVHTASFALPQFAQKELGPLFNK